MPVVLRIMFVAILGCLAGTVHADQKLLRFARLIDGSGEILKGREILVEDGIIVAVGDKLGQHYPSAKIIARDELSALPGIIDVHLHISYGLAEPARGDAWKRLFTTPAWARLQAAKRNAGLTLASGVTSARDLFAFDGVDVQLRALIEAGIVTGPRLFLAGKAIHPQVLPPMDDLSQQDRLDMIRKQAQSRLDTGLGWIKVFATTGSADDLSGRQTYFYPELKMITEMAHAAGRRVAVHSYSQAAVIDALRAGVDSLEHPVGIDDETLARWAESRTVYVPTIDHNRYYVDHREEYGYDREVVTNLQTFIRQNVDTLRHAHTAGVIIAMGSDAVMSGFGQNVRELEWFIEAGMSTREAIRAATVNGATLLGRENFLGRLQPDFAADIVAVSGNPLVDIRALSRNVQWVMKDGEVVVDKQVN